IYNPNLNFSKEMLTGLMVGTVVPAESGNMVLALEDGFYSFDPQTGTRQLIVKPYQEVKANRFNDGKCDPAGRFWAGTMSKAGKQHAGALYRLDPDGNAHKMIDKVSVSNGITLSLDHTNMYYIDTSTQKVNAWDYQLDAGVISNSRTALDVPAEMGAPDGMTIDADGNLWIALWNGSAVGCWNPETGKLLKTIAVPARNVTSC